MGVSHTWAIIIILKTFKSLIIVLIRAILINKSRRQSFASKILKRKYIRKLIKIVENMSLGIQI